MNWSILTLFVEKRYCIPLVCVAFGTMTSLTSLMELDLNAAQNINIINFSSKTYPRRPGHWVDIAMHAIGYQEKDKSPTMAAFPADFQPPDKKYNHNRKINTYMKDLTKANNTFTPRCPAYGHEFDIMLRDIVTGTLRERKKLNLRVLQTTLRNIFRAAGKDVEDSFSDLKLDKSWGDRFCKRHGFPMGVAGVRDFYQTQLVEGDVPKAKRVRTAKVESKLHSSTNGNCGSPLSTQQTPTTVANSIVFSAVVKESVTEKLDYLAEVAVEQLPMVDLQSEQVDRI